MLFFPYWLPPEPSTKEREERIPMDKDMAQKAINSFKWSARPSNPSGSEPATVRDIENLINCTAQLAQQLIKAIES